VIFTFGLVVGLLAVLGGARPESASASCIASARWGGTFYIGMAPPRDGALPLGHRLGRSRIPACIDTIPPSPDEHDTFHGIRRIRGVPPALAFFDTAEKSVYSALGYFPQLPTHPLHALYGAEWDDDHLRGARCQPGVWRRGRIASVTFTGGFLLRSGRRRIMLDVTPRSQIHGFERQGQPYLQDGDRVRVLIQNCILRDGTPSRDALQVWPAP
jgi:hypothetical protein